MRKRTREPNPTDRVLFLAVAAGVVGFFAIPVIGAPIGFVATIYISEAGKPEGDAWTSTKQAVRALVHSIAIEFAGGLVIVAALLVGIFVF